MGTVKDIKGRKFGLLTAVSFSHLGPGGAYWICTCLCGKTVTVRTAHLTTHHSASCGCQKGGVKTHGDTGTRFHHIWVSMKQRCYNPNVKPYRWYGAKGVTVCSAWLLSYQIFKHDMWKSYLDVSTTIGELNVTIDRIDSTKGYYKDNCRWVSRAENTRLAQAHKRESRDERAD